MALSIKHDEADRLARALARETGESLTEAVVTALRERLSRVRRPRRAKRLHAEIQAIQQRVAALPVLACYGNSASAPSRSTSNRSKPPESGSESSGRADIPRP